MPKKRILAVIPARGGSKGLPRKALMPIGGTSLLGHSIACAKAVKAITRIVVSTDDQEYAVHAKQHGADVPFLRPAQYATDDAASIDVFIHALTNCEKQEGQFYDALLALQPTSPLRRPEQVAAAIDQFLKSKATQLVSVSPWDHPLAWSVQVDKNMKLSPHPALTAEDLTAGRQAHGVDLRLNGAIYLYTRDYLLGRPWGLAEDCQAYIMPAMDSIDVDSMLDLITAEAVHRARKNFDASKRK